MKVNASKHAGRSICCKAFLLRKMEPHTTLCTFDNQTTTRHRGMLELPPTAMQCTPVNVDSYTHAVVNIVSFYIHLVLLAKGTLTSLKFVTSPPNRVLLLKMLNTSVLFLGTVTLATVTSEFTVKTD